MKIDLNDKDVDLVLSALYLAREETMKRTALLAYSDDTAIPSFAFTIVIGKIWQELEKDQR